MSLVPRCHYAVLDWNNEHKIDPCHDPWKENVEDLHKYK
jgi:hypothetical protein